MTRAVLLATLALAVSAAPAGAATISVSGPAGFVLFEARAAGSTVDVTQANGAIVVAGCALPSVGGVTWTFTLSGGDTFTQFTPAICTAPGAPAGTAFGCNPISTTVLECSWGGTLFMTGAAGNDDLELASSVTNSPQTIFDTKGGDDKLTSAAPTFSQMTAGAGNDTLTGGTGVEIMVPGLGADEVDGGGGTGDTMSYASDVGRTAGVTVTLNAGNDDDGSVDDFANGRRDDIKNVENVGGTELVDDITGSSAAETLTGLSGADHLAGGGAIDTLTGGGDGDLLEGGDGDDILNGGAGDDTMRGGTNADVMNGDGGNDTVDYSTGSPVESKTITVDAPGGTGNDGSLEDVGAGNARDDIRTTEKAIGGPSGDAITTSLAGITLDGGGGADFVTAAASGSTLVGGAGGDTLNGGAGPDVLRGGADNDQLLAGDGDDTVDGEGGADLMNGGNGRDIADYSTHADAVTVSVDAGSGDDGGASDGAANARDTVTATEVLVGSSGDDLLIGTPAIDRIEGGGGGDRLRGGGAADVLVGGDGTDLADYGDRSAALTLSFDGAPNDGEPGENDVWETIEGATGGAGADTLTGSNGDDVLEGGDGADTITGLAGIDILRGQGGNDDLQARDGNPETVDCGDGADTTLADDSDTLTACETKLVAVTTIDADGDGVGSTIDCNDADAKIRPGAIEIVGNTVDENCDGIKAPFPLTDAGISSNFRAFRTYTMITTLTVLRLPAGAKVVITCKTKKSSQRKRCFKNTTKSFAKQTPSSSFGTLVRKRKLPVGTVVTVTVSAPNVIGKKVVITVRKGKAPTRKTTCQDPTGKTVSC